MKRSTPLPELLAPAGSPEALYAAVSAGADAVYLGGRHSARAFAKNFDEGELREAISYAHLHGRRVYLALNTLLFDRELSDALSYADRVAAMGIDALIVADPGLGALLARHLPSLPLHASTQCFIHNTKTADHYAEKGFSRVVAARELTEGAIGRMVEDSQAEVEVFLHGALCVSHSGQCLFSSLVGGRSGNRGECAQPCRLPYGGRYPLSLRDLSLAPHIPALIAMGVSSLKIEGRMKSPSYVAGVTGIYRRLLDEGRAATEEEMRALMRLFSRGEFTDGYFTDRKDAPMCGIRTEEAKAESRVCEENFTKESVFVTGRVEIRRDAPIALTLGQGERSVTVTGDIPEEATGSPLSEEEVARRLSRLGGTPFALGEGALSVGLDEGLFLPVSALNSLRRAAVDALLAEKGEPIGASYTPSPLPPPPCGRLAVCRTEAQARVARESGFFDRVLLYLPEADKAGYYPDGVHLPPVVTDAEWPAVAAMLARAAAGGAVYAMVESPGQLSAVREAGLIPLGGYRLNITNRESLASAHALGLSDILLSPELSSPRCRDLGARVITYGYLPLMLTERCFVRENFGCKSCGTASLCDRRGVRFPLLREYPHRMLVLNSLPTYLADRPDLLRAAGNPPECYFFTNETEKECRAVLQAAAGHHPLAGQVRRLPR